MKTVLITGSNGGIGRATAEIMDSNGWNVQGVDKGDAMPHIMLENWRALVNCAGVAEGDMMWVNYQLTVEWCQRALVGMARGGHIVNVGSACALEGAPLAPGSWPYVASKYAVHGFTRAFAVEAAPRNIKVNCVAPEGVNTDMYNRYQKAIPAPLQPIDVAKVIFEMCNTEQTGQVIPVYGTLHR